MAGSMGDLVYRVQADTRQFEDGLQRSIQSARSFGSTLNQQASSLGSGFTTQMNALSAGAQDFAAVLGQGGANSLGRAFMATSNNISQFTSMMGPWGAAIGGVGGILASTLIPKLLEGSTATKTFEDSVRELTSSFDGLLKHQSAMVEFSDNWRQFGANLKGIKTSDQAGNMIESMGLKKEKLKDEFDNVKKNVAGFLGPDGLLADVGFKAMQQGKEGALNIPANLTQQQLLEADPAQVEHWLGPDFKDVAETINKQVAEFKRLQREVDQAGNQFDKLKDKQKALAKQEKLQAAGAAGVGGIEDAAKEWQDRQKAMMAAGASGIGKVGDVGGMGQETRDVASMSRGSMEAARAELAANRPKIDGAAEFEDGAQDLKEAAKTLKDAARAIGKVGAIKIVRF